MEICAEQVNLVKISNKPLLGHSETSRLLHFVSGYKHVMSIHLPNTSTSTWTLYREEFSIVL